MRHPRLKIFISRNEVSWRWRRGQVFSCLNKQSWSDGLEESKTMWSLNETWAVKSSSDIKGKLVVIGMKRPSSLDSSSLEYWLYDPVVVGPTFLFLFANHLPMSTLFLFPLDLESRWRLESLHVAACVPEWGQVIKRIEKRAWRWFQERPIERR